MIPNLSKGMIDDMQQLRKRMRSEFGVELRLSQVDILEQISNLASQSKDQRTRTLFEHLQSQMTDVDGSAKSFMADDSGAKALSDAPRHKLKVYRGCPILEEPPRDAELIAQKSIYRGQAVS